jgi:hypothetical protein
MSNTTMIVFKQALLAAIKTRAAGPGVWIGYGDGDGRSKRSIRFRETVTTEGKDGLKPAGFRAGRPRLDESYALRIECEVIGAAHDVALNETAVVALGDAVEDACFDTSVQRLPHVFEVIPTSRGLDTDQTTDGPRSVYVITVNVRART